MKNTILLCLVLTSCSATKLFHKDKERIDSTTHQTKDSVVTKDSVAVHAKEKESKSEIVFDFGDKQITLPIQDSSDQGIYRVHTTAEDYFTFNTRTGEVKTNIRPKNVHINVQQSEKSYDSLNDHSKIHKSDLKDSDTHIQKKEVNKTVHRTNLWWLLLLIPAYLVYRYRKTLWAILRHLLTGL